MTTDAMSRLPNLSHKVRHTCARCLGVLLATTNLVASVDKSIFSEAPGSPVAVGRGPMGIVTGDFNGDGRPDLAVANAGANHLTVLLGEGSGSFRPARGAPLRVGRAPDNLAVGDWNADGKLDLATAAHDGGSEVTILLGDGKGGYRPVARPITSAMATNPHMHALLAGDANGDGKLDLLIANAGRDRGAPALSLSVMLGDGAGGFVHAPGSPLPLSGMPAHVVPADLNRDGRLDLAATTEGGDGLLILLGDGRGGFRSSTVALAGGGHSLAVGDVNGDGAPDLLVTHGTRRLTVLLGDGRGNFAAAPDPQPVLARDCYRLQAADFNGDRRLDIAAVCEQDSLVVVLGDGRGGFRPAAGSPFSTGADSVYMVVADFNGDGKLDIATSNRDGNNLTVLLGR